MIKPTLQFLFEKLNKLSLCNWYEAGSQDHEVLSCWVLNDVHPDNKISIGWYFSKLDSVLYPVEGMAPHSLLSSKDLKYCYYLFWISHYKIDILVHHLSPRLIFALSILLVLKTCWEKESTLECNQLLHSLLLIRFPSAQWRYRKRDKSWPSTSTRRMYMRFLATSVGRENRVVWATTDEILVLTLEPVDQMSLSPHLGCQPSFSRRPYTWHILHVREAQSSITILKSYFPICYTFRNQDV